MRQNNTHRDGKAGRAVGRSRAKGRVAMAAALSLGAAGAALAAGEPEMSPGAKPVTHKSDIFRPDPNYADKPYSPDAQIEIYGGKRAVPTARPLLELGRPQYQSGPLQHGSDVFGSKNLTAQSLAVYGDWRTAVAFNDNGKKEVAQVATRLNLDVDWKITATERIHAFFRPLDQGGQFTRYEFAGNDHNPKRLQAEFDANLDALFFEGDAGAILQGLTGEFNKIDLPFSFGLMPLLFQNGVWVEDAFTGFAFSIPASHSTALDISNMDVTFFAAFDKVSNAAFLDDQNKLADHNVNVYGVTAFIEALRGYFEVGYGYLDGQDGFDDRSYHNLTVSHTRRFRDWVSSSVRAIWNVGQERDNNKQQTADGYILLFENSLITSKPSTLIPYLNLFVGMDRPQSLARDAGAGGVLKNTGINFETDGLTDFPKLDDTGNNTFGGALGVQYLFSLDQQIVVEAASVQVIEGDNEPGRKAKGDEYALGLRYQRPLSRTWIVRTDAIAGWRDQDDDIYGARLEIRRKF